MFPLYSLITMPRSGGIRLMNKKRPSILSNKRSHVKFYFRYKRFPLIDGWGDPFTVNPNVSRPCRGLTPPWNASVGFSLSDPVRRAQEACRSRDTGSTSTKSLHGFTLNLLLLLIDSVGSPGWGLIRAAREKLETSFTENAKGCPRPLLSRSARWSIYYFLSVPIEDASVRSV
jgi:hypothetical protein